MYLSTGVTLSVTVLLQLANIMWGDRSRHPSREADLEGALGPSVHAVFATQIPLLITAHLQRHMGMYMHAR